MSHFTSMKTSLIERDFLLPALRDLGYQPEEGEVAIRGYRGQQTPVQIKIPTANRGYDLGFRAGAEGWELVGDWYGIRDISQAEFLQRLTQRYAYHATVHKLQEQGFTVASEEKQKDGQIHLVLRRMA